jgi:hypothetical protein
MPVQEARSGAGRVGGPDAAARAMRHGMINRQIGERMFLAETVKNYGPRCSPNSGWGAAA